jgi:hypothetical protein
MEEGGIRVMEGRAGEPVVDRSTSVRLYGRQIVRDGN